jgi:putative OmpL-like beta-barrel porin-2
MNGWQNVSENNHGKAIGVRIDWQVSPAVTLGYGNFVGNERSQGTTSATRVFNQVMVKASLDHTTLQGQADYGREAGRDWYGVVAVGRETLTPTLALAARLERYSDPHQLIVVTGAPAGLSANGASLGLDVGRADGLLWRTEVRGLHSTALLFPSHGVANASRNNLLVVTSLALTL